MTRYDFVVFIVMIVLPLAVCAMALDALRIDSRADKKDGADGPPRS